MPKNEGALGAGDSEMTATARLHGEPLMKLNNLTRWFITTSLVVLGLVPAQVLLYFSGAWGSIGVQVTPPALAYVILTLLTGGTLLFAGGMGIKFLPSSMGGNPHVYSLTMALWSYWLILAGVIVGLVFPFVDELVGGQAPFYSRMAGALYGLTTLAGAGLLLFNLSKTMEKRV